MQQQRNMIMIIQIATVLMLSAWASGVWAGSTYCRIRIKPAAELAAGPVALADIARIETVDKDLQQRLQGLVVAEIQEGTEGVQIGYFDLARALAQVQIMPASVDIYGASRCRVTVSTGKNKRRVATGLVLPIPPQSKANSTFKQADTVKKAVKAASPNAQVQTLEDILLERIVKESGLEQNRLQVEWNHRYKKLLQQPYDKNRYRIEPRSHLTVGQVCFGIKDLQAKKMPAQSHRLSSADTFYITGQVRYLCAMVVSRRRLSCGETINADDVKVDIVPISNMNMRTNLDINGVIGKEVARTIPANKPIDSSMLRKVLVVKRRDPVDVVSRVGAVQITLQGIALEEGGLGDIVNVRNKHNSANVISGRIIGPGLIMAMTNHKGLGKAGSNKSVNKNNQSRRSLIPEETASLLRRSH